MEGFDSLGVHDDVIGFDWMELLKGGAGALQGAGGLLSSAQQKSGTPGGGGGGGATAAIAEQERRRLQEERDRAERSSMATKIVLGIVLVFAGLAGIVLVARK